MPHEGQAGGEDECEPELAGEARRGRGGVRPAPSAATPAAVAAAAAEAEAEPEAEEAAVAGLPHSESWIAVSPGGAGGGPEAAAGGAANASGADLL
mmetsp:Transcript_101684/g.328009  ORF Transcript_101684/g.328009 Transcript_101684/m.328009 type:complete len:96 (+) Transcript_101684:417-704(+)